MNGYEVLLDEAYLEGLDVKEKPLLSSDGRIKDNRIAIRKTINTSIEKSCVLAEEIGHYHTSVGDITNLTEVQNRKQERQARIWAYNKKLGLKSLIKAYKHGCINRCETAEFLDVTEEFLIEAIQYYREKYGVNVVIDNHTICFIP